MVTRLSASDASFFGLENSSTPMYVSSLSILRKPRNGLSYETLLETVEQRLRQLEVQWKADTEFLSDAGKIINHRAFQEIIAMGAPVVPLLLKDLESKPSLWVWALPDITGENPVPDSDGGNIGKMTDAWLKWGREKGLR